MPFTSRNESDARQRNRVFISERKKLLDELTLALYTDTAREYRKANHEPPTPDEAALIFEEIDGSAMASSEFAAFCLALSEEYGGNLTKFTESETADDIPKIAYLQNTFSDRAYRKFSSRFEKVSAAYFPGFREVCEEVYNGNCSYAILPISNSNDGQLISFRKLISKYDLKIALAADVEMNDDSVMRFVLLQKGLDLRAVNEMRYLDLSIVLDSSEYGAFLSACDSLGAVVLMMNSLPLEYSDDRFGLSLQFDITGASLDALFFFLEGSHIRYDTVGIYDIIRDS